MCSNSRAEEPTVVARDACILVSQLVSLATNSDWRRVNIAELVDYSGLGDWQLMNLVLWDQSYIN